MIKSIIDKLPFKVKKIEPIANNYYRLYTVDNLYTIKKINKDEEKLIYYYQTISKKVNVPINIIENDNDKYVIYYDSIFIEEELASSKLMLDEELKIFSKSKEAKTLKKQDAQSMKKTYPVLDKYFLRLEYLVREIELKKPKNDFDWLILSKYHIILKTKMIMSQIQNKLFKIMEEETAIEVGLILKYPSSQVYRNGKINYYLESMVAPISELLARFYLFNNHLSNFKKQFDNILEEYDANFYKLHFSFMVLYILILNLNDINTSNILYATKLNEICQQIDDFIDNYSDYFL